MTQPTSGALANKQGNLLESTVRDVFLSKGFQFEAYSTYIKRVSNEQQQPNMFDDESSKDLVLSNVPYTSVYGHKGKTEFLVTSSQYDLNVRIECKWQQSKGSVDEKLPYLYLNCIEAMPEEHIMIVIDGNGFKPGAVSWLRQAAATKLYLPPSINKRIDVFNLTEFLVWANQRLR